MIRCVTEEKEKGTSGKEMNRDTAISTKISHDSLPRKNVYMYCL